MTNFIRSLGFTMVLAISIPTLITLQGQFAKADETPTTLSADTTETQPIGDVWNRTELYFGMSKPDGTTITEAEFKAFMDKEITSRFPDGLTLLTGYGQYLGDNGEIAKETSKVLVLFYPSDMTNANENIEAIRSEYEKLFQQESVLRVDSLEQLSF
jgi:Protein of unknown function (DUF3574)